jgi:LysR family transcriptional regulator, benzoate and cis,cis-muconate-responsive activator of ben and cat genes
MEPRHLRYFVAVAEEQNVTRAATRLHVSQPPLSRQIRDLEREIGVKLFNRGAKALWLTEAGAVFLLEARAVLQRLDEAIELTRAFAGAKRGQVRVGYAPAPAIEILRAALRSFSASHPQVTVDLKEMTTQGMLRGLRARALDVVLTVSISSNDFEGLIVEGLVGYPVKLAAHPKHPFARLRAVPLSAVAGEPLVALTRDEHPEAHAGLLKILASYTSSPSIVAEYDSHTSLITAIEAGRGVALVFHTLSLIAKGRLVLRPVKPSPPLLPVAMAYRSDGISTAASAFVAAVRAASSSLSRSSGPLLTV